jgi:hypothetical protein
MYSISGAIGASSTGQLYLTISNNALSLNGTRKKPLSLFNQSTGSRSQDCAE